MNKQEQTAIEAVARQLRATWQPARGSADAEIVLARSRAPVVIRPLGFAIRGAAKPRLRFDKVVIRLMESLREGLNEAVPDGMTILLALTAPIHVPGKTAEAIEENIRALLRRAPDRDEKEELFGNKVQIRISNGTSSRAPKLIGFVHNPDTGARLFLDAASALLEIISVEARTRAATDRWLVLTGAGERSGVGVYRHILSQLHALSPFKKVFGVLDSGEVECLAE